MSAGGIILWGTAMVIAAASKPATICVDGWQVRPQQTWSLAARASGKQLPLAGVRANATVQVHHTLTCNAYARTRTRAYT